MGNEKGRLTEFGATVMALMASRGIKHLTVLSAHMREEGCRASSSSLSNWFLGKNSPPSRVPAAIGRALELDEEERITLAMAYTYGQDIPARGLGQELRAS
jgi:hypothetical protein